MPESGSGISSHLIPSAISRSRPAQLHRVPVSGRILPKAPRPESMNASLFPEHADAGLPYDFPRRFMQLHDSCFPNSETILISEYRTRPAAAAASNIFRVSSWIMPAGHALHSRNSSRARHHTAVPLAAAALTPRRNSRLCRRILRPGPSRYDLPGTLSCTVPCRFQALMPFRYSLQAPLKSCLTPLPCS